MPVLITGNLQDASGNPVTDAVIRLSPDAATVGGSEAIGGVGILMTPVEVTTDGVGDFTHAAVDFFRYRLEIPSIGFDRYFICPDSAVTPTVSFHLLGLSPTVQTVLRGEERVDSTTDQFVTEIQLGTVSINTVLERFDQIELERSTALAGPWATIATVDLLPSVFFYDVNDATATVDTVYYYRSRYQNSTTGETSQYGEIRASDAQGESALLVSVDELRENYLFGLDLSDDAGKPFPDRMLEWYIKAGIDWLEKELDIDLVAKTHVDELHDHYANDYGRWGYFQLQNYPILAIDEIRFQYPSMFEAVTIDSRWYVLEDNGVSGVIQIVPGQGNIADILMIPGALLPMWSGQTGRVPAIWHIDYRSGFEPLTAPPDIKHAIAMWASIGVLNIAGDLIVGAGIASKSVSLPGLSQNVNTTSSATNAGFGARIIEYQKELKALIPNLRRYYGKGTRMVVV